MMQARTIAIVGAGFSGAVTAIQLMRRAAAPLRVVLVNKSGQMARGLAYGTHSPDHLLNVPAGNMSALDDEPDSFLDYCRRAGLAVQAHGFVPRALYGAYLDDLLERAGSNGPGVLERVVGEVLDVSSADGSRVTVSLDGARRIDCDAVVLAFGHFAPRDVLPRSALDALGARYVADPWSADPLRDVPRDGDVLLVGTGLTALDVVSSLHRVGHAGRIVCVSRHGLVPRGHRREGATAGVIDGAALAAAMGTSLRQQVRVLREATEAAMTHGEDWRDCMAALRAHTPALWQALSLADRDRFLRHVRPYWDALRHRCAPGALDAAQAMQRDGRLEILAGRLCGARLDAAGLAELTVRRRGTAELVGRRAHAVVNCTGPGSDLRRSGVPLLDQLIEKRHLLPDALGLGLAVDDRYAVLDAQGVAQPWLRYIGPLLKARDWEATAVPELRVHARRLAVDLLAGA
ncbi:FAD/NAD(P)-binding protein [Burkholderia sp. WAC0059]|uniref:FAD/NAD(P)-binding protein n=1 Tax=Burkholderia sp. WAC0059 TaxID=2066022 RepID=UPI0015E08383|nr:FAD/NAD(P)-binding protein [Burkholderia sp. WAC0059]